ncbi:MAG: LysM domain-containing protein [Desulfatiglans sp.]|nr:LysM domain-containing protein [Desulfatiglans sp.]
MKSRYFTLLNLVCATSLIIFAFAVLSVQAAEDEKTYDIRLTKTAGIEHDIQKVEDKKVLTETVTVREGDWVWQLLRERGLLEKRNLAQVLSVLKKLNKSLANIDQIEPGEKLVIPLKIVPLEGPPALAGTAVETQASIPDLKDMDLDKYTVEPGDSVIKVIKGRYNIPTKELHTTYLDMVKKLNPSIENLDLIHPGQKITLPIYSPQVVREAIRPAPLPRPVPLPEEAQTSHSPLAQELQSIVEALGERWIDTGRHFVPTPSGGQIDLEAASFPIMDLRSGLRVVVDLNNQLPDRMGNLIQSSWRNYRVVHLTEVDDLRSALDRILRKCDYSKVIGRGETMEVTGDIPIEIKGDWIIKFSEDDSGIIPGIVVINLNDDNHLHTPGVLKNYLASQGIKIIDYPEKADPIPEENVEDPRLKPCSDPSTLVESLLTLTGREFDAQVKIPVYQSEKADLKLVVRADFFLNVDGKDAIIDMTGLGPEITTFLREHQLSLLSLAGEKDPLALISKTLDFVGVQFHKGPLSFMTADKASPKNISFTIPGILFLNPKEMAIFATQKILPDDIAAFVGQKGYKILGLTFPG